MIDHDAIAAHARRCPATDPDAAGAAAYLDLYDEVQRLRAERDALQAQCCMCGKTGLSTIEDGGPECELDDGRWVCSVKCYDRAASNPLEAEAERDRLRAALTIYAQSGNWRLGGCCDPNSPNFTGEAIARQALKGDSDE